MGIQHWSHDHPLSCCLYTSYSCTQVLQASSTASLAPSVYHWRCSYILGAKTNSKLCHIICVLAQYITLCIPAQYTTLCIPAQYTTFCIPHCILHVTFLFSQTGLNAFDSKLLFRVLYVYKSIQWPPQYNLTYWPCTSSVYSCTCTLFIVESADTLLQEAFCPVHNSGWSGFLNAPPCKGEGNWKCQPFLWPGVVMSSAWQ